MLNDCVIACRVDGSDSYMLGFSNVYRCGSISDQGKTYFSPNSAFSSNVFVSKQEMQSAVNAKYTKPSTGIPASDIASGVIPAAQVNSDWNASSGVAQILNKPTIPSNVVQYTAQTLTNAQKAQARSNIGAVADKTLILSDVPAEGDYDIPMGDVWPYGDAYELEEAFQGKFDFVYIYKEGYYDDVSGSSSFDEYILSPIILHTIPGDGSGELYFEVLNPLTAKTVICRIDRGPTGYITVWYADSAPTISTDVIADKTSTTKVSCPKSVYDEVHPAVQTSQPQGGFLPNVEYNLGTLTGSVTFALASAVTGISNKWYWCFKAGNPAPTITWPTGLLWPQPDAEPPTIEANDEVEVEVKNGHIVALVFKPTS